jgi:hypothetical protein
MEAELRDEDWSPGFEVGALHKFVTEAEGQLRLLAETHVLEENPTLFL